ncbi:hypothetical protein [Streptomyces sp. 303MFCol5.2]|nr:hypothetical protein [Streptomyces sp. 303MFCol5.2]
MCEPASSCEGGGQAVGEKEEYMERAWRNIAPYLPAPAPALV